MKKSWTPIYIWAVFAALIIFAVHANAAPFNRSSAAHLAFTKHNACPATGLYTRNCVGYVVDHITPLCAGGPDKPANMQWQEYRASLLKDAQERRTCRALAATKPR